MPIPKPGASAAEWAAHAAAVDARFKKPDADALRRAHRCIDCGQPATELVRKEGGPRRWAERCTDCHMAKVRQSRPDVDRWTKSDGKRLAQRQFRAVMGVSAADAGGAIQGDDGDDPGDGGQ